MRLLTLLLSLNLYGAVTFSNQVSDGATHSSVRIRSDFDVTAIFRVQYGSTNAYGNTSYVVRNFDYNQPQTGPSTVVWFIGGLDPSSTVHYCWQGSQDSGSTWTPTCTGGVNDVVSTPTLALPSPHPADPVPLPAKYAPTAPTVFAHTSVATSCADFMTKLTTEAAHVDGLNYKVTLPAGTVCNTYDLFQADGFGDPISFSPPTRDQAATGMVMITTDAVLPARGTRISPGDAASLVTFQNNLINTGQNTLPTNGTSCAANYLGEFGYGLSGTDITISQCVGGTTFPVTGTSASGAALTVTATGVGAAVSVGDQVDIYGVGGNTVANYASWFVSGKSTDTLSLCGNYQFGGCQSMDPTLYNSSGNWTSGGVVRQHVWATVTPVTTGTLASLRGQTCATENTWAKATDVGIKNVDRMLWCVDPGGGAVWQQMRFVHPGSNDIDAFNFGVNTHHYWLRGIQFLEAPTPTTTFTGTATGWGTVARDAGHFTPGGWDKLTLIAIGDGYTVNGSSCIAYPCTPDPQDPHDLVLEQVLLRSRDDYAKVNNAIGINIVNNLLVTESYVNSVFACSVFGTTPPECTAAFVLSTEPSNGVSLVNNYSDLPGITIFQTDQAIALRLVPAFNWFINRNHFTISDKYFYNGTGSSNGWYYGDRQHIEWKGIQYAEVSGNILENLFTTVAAAIGTAIEITVANYGDCVTYPTGCRGVYPNGIQTTDVWIHDNIIRNSDGGVVIKGHLNTGPNTPNDDIGAITGRRHMISNNIIQTVPRCVPWKCGAPNVYTRALELNVGLEDVQLIHNTVWSMVAGNASIPSTVTTYQQYDSPMEGLLSQNNIFAWPTNDAGANPLKAANALNNTQLGQAALDVSSTKYPSGTSYTYDNNVFGHADPGTFPAGNFYSLNPGWVSTSTPDPASPVTYTLTSGVYRAGQAHPATDGTDMGVNVPALIAAQAGVCADLAFAPTSATAVYTGATGTFDATVTDSACDRAVTSSDSWLTCTANCTGTGSVSGIAWAAAANSGGARSATLSSNGIAFTVNQDAVPPPATTSQTTISGQVKVLGSVTIR